MHDMNEFDGGLSFSGKSNLPKAHFIVPSGASSPRWWGLVQNLATPHMLVGFSWKLEAIFSIFSSSVVGASSPSEAIILPGELLVQKCQEATWLHYLQNGQYLRKASSILQAFYIHSNDRVKTLDLIPVCLLRKGD
jgi:hypothetical protein